MPTPRVKKAALEKGQPPPGRLPSYDWETIAETCIKEPGEWFKIFERDSVSYAVSLRNGDIKALPKDKFEVRQALSTRGRPHDHPDGYEPRQCQLWIRYIGPKKRTTKTKEA